MPDHPWRVAFATAHLCQGIETVTVGSSARRSTVIFASFAIGHRLSHRRCRQAHRPTEVQRWRDRIIRNRADPREGSVASRSEWDNRTTLFDVGVAQGGWLSFMPRTLARLGSSDKV